MTVFLRLISSLVLAIIANILIQLASGQPLAFEPFTIAIIFVACFSMALISPALGTTAPTRSAANGNSPVKRDNSDREQGKVKWFNVSKGYGFITRHDGEDIFVHFRSVRGKGRKVLREGQAVEFVTTSGEKGPQAEDVEIID